MKPIPRRRLPAGTILLSAFAAVGADPFRLNLNKAFDRGPRVCFACALNGYDPSAYDMPSRFWSLQAAYRF